MKEKHKSMMMKIDTAKKKGGEEWYYNLEASRNHIKIAGFF